MPEQTLLLSARQASLALPRTPVLGWSSFGRAGGNAIRSVQQLPHLAFTTSGRAALYQALRQLALPAGSVVLVPTYHCPTMVAPILRAGMQPKFFGISADGLPELSSICSAATEHARAMIVPHYFGLPRSLATVRAWCDQHRVALIEDCAHSFFGDAGERPVGAWGDYSTASISKFLPVSEAGLLGSATRPLKSLELSSRSLTAQIKGLVDVLEPSVRYGRLHGLNAGLDQLFRWKNRRKFKAGAPAPTTEADTSHSAASVASMMHSCDMDRIDKAPLWICTQLARRLPHGRVVSRRRANFTLYSKHFDGVRGARPLFPAPPPAVAPYVFPLWVDDADRVYDALRAIDAPVFRWDRIWPGTPMLSDDQGPLWSRHVLQLLCHQDLSADDVTHVARVTTELLHP